MEKYGIGVVFMKKALKVLLLAVISFVLITFAVRAENSENTEYAVRREGDTYLLTAYSGGAESEIIRTGDISDVFDKLSEITDTASVLLCDIATDSDIILSVGSYRISGKISMLGGANLIIDGANAVIDGCDVSLFGGNINVKRGALSVYSGNISAAVGSAVLLGHSASAEFSMHGGSIRTSSRDAAISVSIGSALIRGGEVKNDSGVAVRNSSTLILSGSPIISGCEFGIYTSTPITLAYKDSHFAGDVSVQYGAFFAEGSINCTFYSASESSLKGIFLHDEAGKRYELSFFETHRRVNERNFGAVYLPYTVNFYDGGTLYESEEVLFGELVSAPFSPERSGYEFIGWSGSGIGGNIFDFASSVSADIELYAEYRLSLPSFSISSLSFVYDRNAHSFGLDKLEHALINEISVSYTWYRNGVFFSDIGPAVMLKNVSDSGTYKCRIVISHGTDSVTVETPDVAVNVSAAKVPVPTVSDKVYNGEYQSPDLYSTALFTVFATPGCQVGTYPIEIRLTDMENYEFFGGGDFAYTEFSIVAADNFFTSELKIEDIYEGGEPSPFAACRFGEVKYLFSERIDGEFSELVPTEVGEYYCIAHVVGSENYRELRSDAVKFSIIEEKILGISVYRAQSKVDYFAFDSFLTDGLVLSVSYNSGRTELVEGEKAEISYLSAENLRYGDGAVLASYCGTSVAVAVNVSRIEYDLSDITDFEVERVFNGERQTLDIIGNLPMGLDGIPLTATVSGGGKDVGSYTVLIQFFSSSQNYILPKPISVLFNIKPYESRAVFRELEFVYDGIVKCPSAYYIDIYGRKIELSVSGGRSLAGEYVALCECADRNYKIVGASAAYKIAKADYNFENVYWSESDFTYDGEEKCVYVCGLPSGVSVIGYSDNKGINAGKYVANTTLDYDKNNYNPPPEISCFWEIKRAEYDLSGFRFSDATYVFCGVEQYPKFNGKMPVGVDGIELRYHFKNGATHVSEGVVECEIVFESESDNYILPENKMAKVEIKPFGVYAVWSDVEFTYDSQKHAPRAHSDLCTLAVIGGATDAGKYSATAISLNSDYCVINSEMEFVIQRAKNVWTQSLYVSNVFEGREPSPNALALGGEVKYIYYTADGAVLDSPPKSAGRYFVSAKTDGGLNYEPLESERVEFFVIAVVPISLKIDIDGEEFFAFSKLTQSNLSASVINNDGSVEKIPFDALAVSYQNGDSLRVKDSYVTVSYSEFSQDVSIRVERASYDLSGVYWSNGAFVYDGKEKTVALFGLPSGVTVKEYVSCSGVDAGEYEGRAFLSYDAENYNEPIIEGVKFKIRKMLVTLPTVESLVYSGAPQSPKLPESSIYTATYEQEIFAGRYQVLFSLIDEKNCEFENGLDFAVAYYDILPRKIKVTLSDVNKYKDGEMTEPTFVIDGDIAEGDELLLKFLYIDDSVTCVSENRNYSLEVIPGKIIRHSTYSESMRSRMFIIALIALTVLLLVLIIITRRKDILHYASVIRCRFSPIASAEPSNFEKADSADEPPESGSEAQGDVMINPMSVDVTHADSLITDSMAKELLRREDDAVITSGKRKRIINVDTLSQNFSSGDTVDVNKLKEMSLVPYDTAYIKVLARGMIDKPLTVRANDFSLSAVKMIALTGGEAVKVVTLKKKRKNSEKSGEKY